MRQLYEELEGKDSEGWKRCNEDLLNINDIQLKRRAGNNHDFFEQNNEKPTSIFFSLGKDKEGDDNIAGDGVAEVRPGADGGGGGMPVRNRSGGGPET